VDRLAPEKERGIIGLSPKEALVEITELSKPLLEQIIRISQDFPAQQAGMTARNRAP